MSPHDRTTALSLLSILLIVVACQPAADDSSVEIGVQEVTVDSAGIRIAMLPAGTEIAANDATGFEISTEPSGSIEITLGEVSQSGLNIVETVKLEMAAFEELPDGQSFGQNQLVAPIGLTYVVRGRYTAAGIPTEELRALVVHPWGNRLLSVSYRYPLAEDTSDRAALLMELLGEIEPLPEPPPADPQTPEA